MKVSIATRGLAHQREWGALLAEGLAAHNVEPVFVEAGRDASTTVVVCWGWRIGQRYRDRGHEVLVAERGYVGDRFYWTSLGWNGLNGRADFRNAGKDGDRWARHFSGFLSDWRERSGPTVIMGQVPNDTALLGINYQAWLNKTAAALPGALFRPHPGAPAVRCGLPLADGDLAAVLEIAGRVVVFNSNSATDAVLAGVPTVTIDPGAMAWPVAGQGLNETVSPDRTQWCNELAWTQWAPEEIRRGDAWEHIGKGALEC